MTNKLSIRFYRDHEVRAIWNEEENKWFFSIVDIVAAITESPRPRVYWGTVKNRQKAQYGELYSKCIQLKLLSADGKRYATDCFAQEDIIEVVKTLPAKNTTAFLDWFTYSDNSIDGQSRKKAYTFWESNIIDEDEIGSVKALQKIHAYIFGGLYDFAGQIRTTSGRTNITAFFPLLEQDDICLSNLQDGNGSSSDASMCTSIYSCCVLCVHGWSKHYQ